MLSGLKIRRYIAKTSPKLGKATIKQIAQSLARGDEDLLTEIRYYSDNLYGVIIQDRMFELNMLQLELKERRRMRENIEKYYKAKEACELRKRRQHPDRYFIKSLRS